VYVAPLTSTAGFVSDPIDRFAPRRRLQARVLDCHREGSDHPPRGHLVHQRVEPVDEKQIVARRLAGNRDRALGAHGAQIGDDARERERSLLERRGLRRAESANADVGSVREVLPPRC
jgi:hypothetical protein